MKALARFGILLVALTAVTGWILSRAFPAPAEKHAILVSGVMAVLIQLGTFWIAEAFRRKNALLTGWGIGAVIRGTVLVVYGLIGAKLFGLPLAASLVSFAVFLFASMLLESFLIAYASH